MKGGVVHFAVICYFNALLLSDADGFSKGEHNWRQDQLSSEPLVKGRQSGSKKQKLNNESWQYTATF